MPSFGICLSEEDTDLPKLYWIPKLHKNPYKQRYIEGSTKFSTKPLSQILTRILTAVEEGLQKYCNTAYARGGVNQMWILQNSKEPLEHLKAKPLVHSVNSIKSVDFSTLYTTIPHEKLKSNFKEIINHCFFHKNGNRRFQYAVLGSFAQTHISFRTTLTHRKNTLAACRQTVTLLDYQGDILKSFRKINQLVALRCDNVIFTVL